MDNFSKCSICIYNDYYGYNDCFCNNYDSFKPNKEKIIELSKENGISIQDVIALCNM